MTARKGTEQTYTASGVEEVNEAVLSSVEDKFSSMLAVLTTHYLASHAKGPFNRKKRELITSFSASIDNSLKGVIRDTEQTVHRALSELK